MLKLNSDPLKAILLILVCCFMISSIRAQEYFKKYTSINDLSNTAEIEILDDGNILYYDLLKGSTLQEDTLLLTKLNTCGEVIFGHKYFFQYDHLFSTNIYIQFLKIGPTGYPYLLLDGQNSNNHSLLLIKFSKDASNIIWAKSYCCTSPNIKEFNITDSSTIFVGLGSDPSINSDYPKVLKIDSSGNVLNYFQLNDRPLDNSYDFYFKEENSFLFHHRNNLTSIDLGGNIIWKKSYTGISYIRDITSNSAGSYIIAGQDSITVLNIANTKVFYINSQGQYINRVACFKRFEAPKFINSFGKIFISGRSQAPSTAPYSSFGHIYQLSNDPNELFGYYQSDYTFGYYNDLEYSANNLYFLSFTYDPSNFNDISLIRGKVSTDPANFFCNDGSLLDTLPFTNVTSSDVPLTSSGITSLSLTTDSLIYTVIPASLKTDSMCYLHRDYSSLFTTKNFTMCKGEYLDITRPEIYGTSFSWSTGDTSEFIRVYEEGAYWVNMTFPCDDSIYTDTVFVTFYPEPDTEIITSPHAAELNENINFALANHNYNDSIFWVFQDSLTSSQTNFSRSYESSGWKYFSLYIFTTDGCTAIINDSVLVYFQEVSIPNIFTPNGDGINDIMYIKGEGFTSFEIRIFDRWGSQIAELKNAYWDGIGNDGSNSADGVYFYIFKYITTTGEEITKKGNVTLMRNRQ